MNKKQQPKLNMYHSTNNCLTANDAKVQTIPALAEFHTQLDSNIDEIEEQAEIQESVTKGVRGDKETKRKALCKKAAAMAGFVKSWATTAGETEIAEKMSITYSNLFSMEGTTLAERCQSIHDTANTHLAALADYGVTAGKLNALATLITIYAAKATAPRDAKIISMAATKALEDLFANTDLLLNEQMEPLMNNFEDSDKGFFNQYKAARVIVDAGTASTQIKGTVTKALDETPLAGAAIATVVNGAPVAVKSKADGRYKLVVPPGTYNITVSLAGYVTQSINNITLTPGQAVEVDVVMIAV